MRTNFAPHDIPWYVAFISTTLWSLFLLTRSQMNRIFLCAAAALVLAISVPSYSYAGGGGDGGGGYGGGGDGCGGPAPSAPSSPGPGGTSHQDTDAFMCRGVTRVPLYLVWMEKFHCYYWAAIWWRSKNGKIHWDPIFPAAEVGVRYTFEQGVPPPESDPLRN